MQNAKFSDVDAVRCGVDVQKEGIVRVVGRVWFQFDCVEIERGS